MKKCPVCSQKFSRLEEDQPAPCHESDLYETEPTVVIPVEVLQQKLKECA